MAQSGGFCYEVGMIRGCTLGFASVLAFGGLAAAPAYAQTTDQTDQSEEDWRKSQKKRDAGDILEDILNKRSTGSGSQNTGPVSPLENLPEESRRHIKKERAKVMASHDPNNIPDVPYTPSEAARADEKLAKREEKAWKTVMEDLKDGGSGQNGDPAGQQAGQPGGSQAGDSQAGTDQSSQGTGSGQSQDGSNDGDSSQPQSVMRGGSSASVADILAQIKGMQGGQGNSPDGSPDGQPNGNSQGQNGQGQTGQGQTGSGGQSSETAGEQSGQTDGSSAGGDSQQAENGQSGDAAQTGGSDGSDAATGASAQARQNSPSAEAPIGPLDRLKDRERPESTGGSQTSAYDFLKRDVPGPKK